MRARKPHEEWDVRAIIAAHKLKAGFTLPVRSFIRKYRSKRFTLAEIPVYLVKANRDHRVAWTALDDSMQLLERVSPLWINRMHSFFSCIMITEKADRSHYYLADRCYVVNPWILTENAKNPASVPVFLAGDLVYQLSHAMFLHGRFGLTGIRWCFALSIMAEVQFLRKLAAESDDYLTVLALIGTLVKSKRFKVWREKRRLPMPVRFKGGVFYETGREEVEGANFEFDDD